jgi:hypothetical protein
MPVSGRGSEVIDMALISTSLLAAVLASIAPPAPADAAPRSQQSCQADDGYAASFDGRRTFILQPSHLQTIKASIGHDVRIDEAYAALMQEAEAALGHGPYTVTDKPLLPPSGDRHDYISLAPYWWPDPRKGDEAPYVRRDGEFNPERLTNRFDVADLDAMSTDVETLALAYYYSGDTRFANRAVLLLRTWFIDPETRMNPRLDYAQMVPGREDGRAEGIMDTHRLARVVESIGLLAPSGAIAEGEQAALESWFGAYVDWLLTSPNGREEGDKSNNHSIWYDSQVMHFALFARKPDVARTIAAAFPQRRLARQFEPDGRLPEELTRTRTLHYSIFALLAGYDVADLAGCVDIDLWNWQDAEGRGLKTATLFLAPYSGRENEWPLREIDTPREELSVLLTRAQLHWGDPALAPKRPATSLTLRYVAADERP